MKFPKLAAAFTLATLLLGTGFATQLKAESIDGPKVSWKLAVWGSPRAFSAGMEEMATRVSDATGGNFEIRIIYGSQLSDSRENLDGIKLNAFEGPAICNFFHPDKDPAWMVFSLPFLPLGDPEIGRFVRSRMMKHLAIVEDMELWDAIPYVSGLLPQYELLGKGAAPTTLEGWKGMRVRAGGGIGAAMEKIGAVKRTLPAEATLTAFQSRLQDFRRI